MSLSLATSQYFSFYKYTVLLKSITVSSEVVEGAESILEKRSGRLCLRVFPLQREVQKSWRQQRSKERSVTGTAADAHLSFIYAIFELSEFIFELSQCFQVFVYIILHLAARMIVCRGIIKEEDCTSQVDVRRDDNRRQVLLFETTDVVYNHSK